MPISLAQLPASLDRSIAPVYLIAGSEPLLVQDAREMVVAAAREQGFDERQLVVVDRGFNWEDGLVSASAPSLFTQRKVIDLRLASGKPGTEGARVLGEWAQAPDADTVLVLSFGNWSAASRNTKWAKALERGGVIVEIWPLKPEELPGWIKQRLAAAGLAAKPEAVTMLAELVEGNLLAAQQEIDKLALISTGAVLDAGDIERAVASSAQFSGFRLAECALRGDAATSLRVAAGLQRNNIAIQAVAAALYNEIALTGALIDVRQSGQDERSFFSRARIWPQRQGPMRMAAQRLSPGDMDRVFHLLAIIDLQGKGRAPGDPWLSLDQLLLHMCQPGRQKVAVEA